MNNSIRLHSLDRIRFFVVLTLIPFHTAITFTGNGDSYVLHPMIKEYYLGIVSAPPFYIWGMNIMTDFLSSFFMNLLFLIAGMSSYFALKRRSMGEYAKERVKKLVVPTFMGVVLYISLLSYYRNISLFGFTGSFLQFYPQFFNGIRGSFDGANFEWGHLWFLVYLFVYSMFSLPVFRKSESIREPNLLKGKVLKLSTLPLIIIVLELILRPGWPGFQNLYNDWANFTNYLIFFLSGFFLARFPGIRKTVQKPYRVYLIMGVLVFAIKFCLSSIIQIEWGYNGTTRLYVLLNSICTMTLTLGFLGLGEARFNHASSRLKFMRDFSFPLYILHYIPLTVLTQYFLKTDLPFYAQWFLSSLLSFPTTYLLYKVIGKIPVLRLSLGIC